MVLADLYKYPSYSIVQFAQVCYLAKQFGVPVLLWAQGLGPLQTAESRILVRDLFSTADYVSVRDKAASEALGSLGVNKEIQIAPDPVWALPLRKECIDLESRFPEIAGRRVLIVNALFFPFERSWESIFLSALEATLPDGWVCLWMPFQSNDYAPHPSGWSMPDDESHFRGMIQLVRDPGRHLVWQRPDVFECLSAFASASALVVMRFHGAILGCRSDAPLLVVEYDQKVSYAMDQAGLEDRARVELLATRSTYEARLSSLFQSASAEDARRPRVDSLALAEQATVHSELLRHACLRSAKRSPIVNWCSAPGDRPFDWLSAWITQLERDRWRALESARLVSEDLEPAGREGNDAASVSSPVSAGVHAREGRCDPESANTSPPGETATAELRRRIFELTTRLDQSEQRVEALLSSASWRVTKPARQLLAIISESWTADGRSDEPNKTSLRPRIWFRKLLNSISDGHVRRRQRRGSRPR